MTEGVLIALITSITALCVAIVTSYFTFKANERISELKDQNEHQQQQLDKLKRNNTALWSWILSLVEQIRRSGNKPVPPPDALKSDPELAKLIVFEQYQTPKGEGGK